MNDYEYLPVGLGQNKLSLDKVKQNYGCSLSDVFKFLAEKEENKNNDFEMKEVFYTQEEWNNIIKKYVDANEIMRVNNIENGGPRIVARTKIVSADFRSDYANMAKEFEQLYLDKLYFKNTYESYRDHIKKRCPQMLGQDVFSEYLTKESRDMVLDKEYRPPFIFDTLYSIDDKNPLKIIETQSRGYGYLDEFKLLADVENEIKPGMGMYDDGTSDAINQREIAKQKLTGGEPIYIMDSNPLTGVTCNDQILMAKRLSDEFPLAPLNIKTGELNIYSECGKRFCKVLDTKREDSGRVVEIKHLFNRMNHNDIKGVAGFIANNITKELGVENTQEIQNIIGSLLIEIKSAKDHLKDLSTNQNTDRDYIEIEVKKLKTIYNFLHGLDGEGILQSDIHIIQGPHLCCMVTKEDNRILDDSDGLRDFYAPEYHAGDLVINETEDEQYFFIKPTDGNSAYGVEEKIIKPGENFTVPAKHILQTKIICREKFINLFGSKVGKKYEMRIMFYPRFGKRDGQLGVGMGRVGVDFTNHGRALADARNLLDKNHAELLNYRINLLINEEGLNQNDAIKKVVTELMLYGDESLGINPCIDLGLSRIVRNKS